MISTPYWKNSGSRLKRQLYSKTLFIQSITISDKQLVWAQFVKENKSQHRELYALRFANSVWGLLRAVDIEGL